MYLGQRFHRLGEQRMYDTLRFWTMSAADFLDEYFESEIVKAHFAGSSIIGTALGPRSPGTAYVLLHHYMGDIDDTVGAWGFARGGMGAISNALGKSFEASGGTIRSAAPVAQILVKNGRAAGVVLDDGEEIHAPLVISNLDVQAAPSSRSWMPRTCPTDFLQRVKNFKIRGSSGKLNIALDGLPRFPAIPEGSPCTRGDMHVTDTLEMMERAYDDWKEGRWSRAPYIDMLIPSQIDPTMVPDGKHYMSVFVQYCPYELADGEWNAGEAPGFRRHGDRYHRAAQPEFQGPDPARGDPHAVGHRERSRLDRRQHLPGRVDHGSAAVQPAGAGLRAIPLAGARRLHVRLEHPPGRRRHGCAGRQRGARGAQGSGPDAIDMTQQSTRHALRLHRHRRRTQRPGVRRQPGARRPLGAGGRGAAAGRRRGAHARVRTRVSSVGLRAPAASDARRPAAMSCDLGSHGLKWAAQAMPTTALTRAGRAAHDRLRSAAGRI